MHVYICNWYSVATKSDCTCLIIKQGKTRGKVQIISKIVLQKVYHTHKAELCNFQVIKFPHESIPIKIHMKISHTGQIFNVAPLSECIFYRIITAFLKLMAICCMNLIHFICTDCFNRSISPKTLFLLVNITINSGDSLCVQTVFDFWDIYSSKAWLCNNTESTESKQGWLQTPDTNSHL